MDELTKRINAYLGIEEDANKYVFVPGTGTDGATIDDATDFATYFKKNGSTDMTAEDAKKLLENTDVKAIKFYRGGKTYYWSKPIKHFGDYYTPIVEDNDNLFLVEALESYKDKISQGDIISVVADSTEVSDILGTYQENNNFRIYFPKVDDTADEISVACLDVVQYDSNGEVIQQIE